MAELDRTLAPEFRGIERIPLLAPVEAKLDNGIPVYLLDVGTQDVVKIELWSNAGSVFGEEGYLAAACAKLMPEGTTSKSAEEIANGFDHYGAHLESKSDKEHLQVALFTMNRFLEPTFDSFVDVVMNANFPEEEVRVYAEKQRQQIQLGLEKVGTLATRAFTANLFGKGHEFGKVVQPNDLSNLQTNQLKAHHQNVFLPRISRIVVSGKIPESLLVKLNAAFGKLDVDTVASSPFEFPSDISETAVHVEKEGAVQNAIKIGRPMFNRLHEDFIGMQVLSTVLGGYFGSRLMSNIREDKGYTYGIGCSMQSFKDSGYFVISTEVGSGVCSDALKEIYFELDRLCNEPIPEEELNLVKNYIMGVQLKSTDGPFALASKWNSLINFGLDSADHEKRIDEILAMDSGRLQDIANKYLKKEMLLEVVAGKV